MKKKRNRNTEQTEYLMPFGVALNKKKKNRKARKRWRVQKGIESISCDA